MILSELEKRYLLAVRRWFYAKDVELEELTESDKLDLYLVMRQDGQVRSFERWSLGIKYAEEARGKQAPQQVTSPKEEDLEGVERKTVIVPRELTLNPEKLAGCIFDQVKGPTRYVQATPISA